jgi:sec-independent protein translocase protein TatC
MSEASVQPKAKDAYDPDEYRMTIGEHLEDLRRRIFRGLGGLVAALVICTPLAKHLLAWICRPLVAALQANDLNPQLFTDETTEAFMAWVQVSLIAAAALAGPWMVYQLWEFIAAGLYPRERKAVTKYIPLAIALLITGMAFVYYIVLPLTMRFFVAFTLSIPLDLPSAATVKTSGIADTQPSFVQHLSGDPVRPQPYQMWVNTEERRLKINIDGSVRNIPFGGDNLMAAHFKLGDYLDLVFRLLLTFGLCFQLPLVVMVLARLGIVEISQLTHLRRHVYFGMTVLAAIVSPGDVVTATLALLAPLILLYELGIILARLNAAGPSDEVTGA